MARYLYQRFGDYQLMRLLGEGGFAEVYEAKHVHLGTQAAVKILKDAFTSTQIEELRKEALIVSALNHPHVVRLVTFSMDRGIPYLVMSYASGGSLDKLCPRGGKLALPTVIAYVRQIAAALQYAHDQRIIHRDLKPANFLVIQDGRIQVADFGIALMAHSSTSWTEQQIAGTWTYMAPEQFQKKAVPASDQYSLAIVVYQWLCGEPPFISWDNPYTLPYQHMHVQPPPLGERVPNLSPTIEQIVMKALAKDPKERFASIQDFAKALADANDVSVLSAPGQRLGDYRLVRLLGSGGFADVYEAEHIHLGTKAAIKILKGNLSSEQIDVLRREARLVMELDHPHIVRVFTFSVERSLPYLVMSYAPGGSLDAYHPSGVPLQVETILPHVQQIASALQYAHDQNIIHRDIKPDNVLLSKDGRLLLADFGMALMASTTQAYQPQQIIGTWYYMAPEQFEGKALPASDQYALAIMTYRWLCGELPFTGNIHTLPYQHMNTLPPSLREKVPTLSSAVEQVVMKALSKKPEERFASVQAFADALEEASHSLPNVQTRDNTYYKLSNYTRLRKLGEGEFYEVYQLMHNLDRHIVALKVISSRLAKDIVYGHYFQREIEITRGLQHPHVVKFLDSGVDNNCFYYLMEYCEGGSVNQMVKRRRSGCLTLAEAKPIVLGAVEGLAYLHQQGIVHRNIKPQDILLSGTEAYWQAKIANLQRAQNYINLFSSPTSVIARSFEMSLSFMPREQMINFKYVKPVSDVWAMGATIYFMLTGNVPRPGKAGRDPIDALLNGQVIPIRQCDPNIPKEVADVIDRSLARDAKDRYQTAGEMLKALRTVLK